MCDIIVMCFRMTIQLWLGYGLFRDRVGGHFEGILSVHVRLVQGADHDDRGDDRTCDECALDDDLLVGLDGLENVHGVSFQN